MGEPRQWMVIVGLKRCKSPGNTFFVEARMHVRVFINQDIVIQVYKVVTGQLMKNYQRYKDQYEVDEAGQTIRLHIIDFSRQG
jgi:hypothetical protein